MALTNISNLRQRIKLALAEDIGQNDITSSTLISAKHRSLAVIVAKQAGTLCGIELCKMVCACVDRGLATKTRAKDGAKIVKGRRVLSIRGRTVSILKAERTILNFMQHLSGIATITNSYVKAVKGTNAKIIDTRKTTPLWRDIEKYAVTVGGGANHRMGLHDAVLIKENHISAAGSIAAAVERIHLKRLKKSFVEVEAKNVREMKEAYSSGVDRIMFDNMRPEAIKRGLKWLKAQQPPIPKTEASGGITLTNVKRYANTGVDFISIGGLTNSPGILDLSLLIQ